MKIERRALGALFLALTVPMLVACGSSDDDAAGGPAEVADTVETGDEDAGSVEVAETAPPETAPPETAPAADAGSVVRVSGGTTDPWEIAGYCEWTPDNTGGASSLYVVEDTDEARDEEITILEVWPFNIEDDSETSIIGSIVEPGGNLLTVIDVDPSFDGTTITLLVGVVNGVNFSETPEFTVTVTCGP